MELKISKATEADIPAIVEIMTAAVQYKLDHGDDRWGREKYTEEEIKPRLAAGNTYVAKLGSDVIGTLMLLWEDEMMWGKQPPNAGYIHQLATNASYHGRQIGVKMMDWAAQQVAKNDRQFLRLDCDPDNVNLCGYYENQGFKRIKVHEIHRPNIEPYLAALYERPVT